MRTAANPTLMTFNVPRNSPPSARVTSNVSPRDSTSHPSGRHVRCAAQKRAAISIKVDSTELRRSRSMPPEISLGIKWRDPRKPTALSFIRTMSRNMPSDKSVCSRSGNATFSNTLRSANSAPNWNSIPIRRRAA